MSKVFLSFVCAVLFAATSVSQASGQHCPDCGQVVSSPVTVYQAQPVTSYAAPVTYAAPVGQAIVYQQPVYLQPAYQQTSYVAPVSYTTPVSDQSSNYQSYGGTNNSAYSHAQRSAQYRANNGIKGHAMTAGYTEGVGFSTRSAQDAIRQCCYSGSNMSRQVSVVRGRDGWYATSVYNR